MPALGFINAFDELADPDRRLGRKVANYGMVAALLEYSQVEELHFFLPFQGAGQAFTQGYAPWLEKQPHEGRVRLLPALALPGAVERGDYLALHAGELDRYFPELCHLRNRWARQPFPITCTPHSLNYWSTQVRNLYKVLPGPQPYDAIFCTSAAARQYLENYFQAAGQRLRQLGLTQAGFPGRLEIAPLGVRLEEFAGQDREAARAALGLEPGVYTLLCLGRLNASEKYDLMPLLGVLALLKDQRPLRLVLAGADFAGYGRQIKEAASQLGLAGGVHLFTDFDSSQKGQLLAAADVFVSPADNLQETFGLTIIEAMAAGLPVVASDFDGYRDLIKDGETGFLIPTLGPADHGPMDAVWPLLSERVAAVQTAQRTALDLGVLAQRLGDLMDQPELGPRLGAAGRQRVEAHFTWQVVVRRMEELWAQLKQQAMAQPRQPAPADVLDAGQAQLFGHYPSHTLDPDQPLYPGPLATAFAQGSWARHPHADAAPGLPLAGLEQMLAHLQGQGGPASLAQLRAALGGSLPAYLLEHLALFGLKYGVLALAPALAPRP